MTHITYKLCVNRLRYQESFWSAVGYSELSFRGVKSDPWNFDCMGRGSVSLTRILFKSQLCHLFDKQIKVDPILSFLQLDFKNFLPALERRELRKMRGAGGACLSQMEPQLSR